MTKKNRIVIEHLKSPRIHVDILLYVRTVSQREGLRITGETRYPTTCLLSSYTRLSVSCMNGSWQFQEEGFAFTYPAGT